MFSQKFLISVLLGCSGIPASAALTVCTTTPSCVTGAEPDDTFSNISVTQGNLSTSSTDDGVTFTDLAGLTGVMGSSLMLNGWPAGTAIESGSGVTTMTITLPSSVNAIDFYAGMQDFSFFTISVTDSTGGTYTSGSFEELGSPVFFGISTSSTFTSFTITSQGGPDQITLDDISFGTGGSQGGDPAPTPEAATLLLVATGLFLMRYARRWMPNRMAA
jgi:hypothetical protein